MIDTGQVIRPSGTHSSTCTKRPSQLRHAVALWSFLQTQEQAGKMGKGTAVKHWPVWPIYVLSSFQMTWDKPALPLFLLAFCTLGL